MKVQPTTKQLIAMLYERLPELFDRPQRQRSVKPLTDDQIMDMYNEPRSDAEMLEFARAIEAAHGITKE